MKHIYCKLPNGELVSKRDVDRAMETINKLMNGFTLVELSDDELFAKGNKVEAVMHFHNKHNVGLVEAKAAIEFLREEDEHNG